MEQKIIDILQKHFKGQNINEARKELCFLFDVRRSDSPKCPKCGADETKQSSIGEWEDGIEYRCDECGNEWEFHHFA